MSAEERTQILRMVAEGKVSPEEAEKLLAATSTMEPPPARPVRPNRKLLIQVQEDGEQRVHVCIPLSLAKAASRLIPRQAQEHLDEYELSIEELLKELANIDGEGILIQVNDDDSQVRISVE
jgi:hypothetical protein